MILLAAACAACGAVNAAADPTCTTVVGPKADLAATIERAAGGATICLRAGRYPPLRLNRHPLRFGRMVTVRSGSGGRATLGAITLARVSGLRFSRLELTGPVSLGGGDRRIFFTRDRLSRPGLLRLNAQNDPGGAASRLSTAPAPSPAPMPITGSPTGSASAHDCFSSPAACGLPDPANGSAGANCAALPRLNLAQLPPGLVRAGRDALEIVDPNTRISDLAFPSSLGVLFGPGSSGSSLDHVCILVDGGGASGSTAVQVARGVTHVAITHSTLGGLNPGAGATDQAITNDTDNPQTTAEADVMINCGECVHGTWTVRDSYVDANATIPGEHYEDWYFSDGTIAAVHDVLLNPHEQTANIFGDVNGGRGGRADNHITLTDSLLAGGGFMLYADASARSLGSSTLTVTGNRFARCRSAMAFDAVTGGTACAGGRDTYGFWRNGGYFGVDTWTVCTGAGQRWSDNVWDDDNAPVPCVSSLGR